MHKQGVVVEAVGQGEEKGQKLWWQGAVLVLNSTCKCQTLPENKWHNIEVVLWDVALQESFIPPVIMMEKPLLCFSALHWFYITAHAFFTGADGKPELPPGQSAVWHRKPAHLPTGGADRSGCWSILCGTDCSGHCLHIQVRGCGIVWELQLPWSPWQQHNSW